MITHVTYAETEFIRGERVRCVKQVGEGVRGNPYRDIVIDGVIALVWRHKRHRNALRWIAIDMDGGGRLIACELFVFHLKRKPPRVLSTTHTGDDSPPPPRGAA